jgi:hypothetical protein
VCGRDSCPPQSLNQMNVKRTEGAALIAFFAMSGLRLWLKTPESAEGDGRLDGQNARPSIRHKHIWPGV